MARGNRKLKIVYPDERDDRRKDANKKLKSEVKRLRKQLKQSQSENRTLTRAFNKSCDFIQSRLKNYSLEEIIRMINNFDYKETEKGREKEENSIVVKPDCCPQCKTEMGEGYRVMSAGSFDIEFCTCGYRSRVDENEGNERG